MKNRYKIVPSSYLIVIDDNKILLARRCNTGFEDGKYGLVAGHGGEGETFSQTLIREVKEESGLVIAQKDLEVVHIMHRKSDHDERVDIFFLAKKWQGEPKIMEPNKCDDMGWFPLDDLPNNTIDYIRFAIEKINDKEFYSEYGW